MKKMLKYEPLKQENYDLCWQTITNIFSCYYTGKPYFTTTNSPKTGRYDAVNAINAATGKALEDLIDGDFPEYPLIAHTIKKGQLIYIALHDVTLDDDSLHDAIIVGFDDNGERICIYDPTTGVEQWHAYKYGDSYQDSTSGKTFDFDCFASI